MLHFVLLLLLSFLLPFRCCYSPVSVALPLLPFLALLCDLLCGDGRRVVFCFITLGCVVLLLRVRDLCGGDIARGAVEADQGEELEAVDGFREVGE